MISHLLKEKSVLFVLVFIICSIPAFTFADEDKTSKDEVKDESYYGFGLEYIASGKYQEAIDAFKQVIRIEPDHALSHYGLGFIYGKIGKYQKAVNAFKQVISIEPDFAGAYYFLGLAYLHIGDNGSAFDQYKILEDLDKESANELFNAIYP